MSPGGSTQTFKDQPLFFYLTPTNIFMQIGINGPKYDTQSLSKVKPSPMKAFYQLTDEQIAIFRKMCMRNFESSKWFKQYSRLLSLLKSNETNLCPPSVLKQKYGSFVSFMDSVVLKQLVFFGGDTLWAVDIFRLLIETNQLENKNTIYVAVPTHFNDLKRRQIMNSFQICGMLPNRIHFLDMGLVLSLGILSESTMVINKQIHNRLIFNVDENGLEIHAVSYSKSNFSIKTIDSVGSFKFCPQEFAYDCSISLMANLPWGLNTPSIDQVYADVYKTFSDPSFIFPPFLPFTFPDCKIEINQDSFRDVINKYTKIISDKLFIINNKSENIKFDDYVVNGIGVLSQIVKRYLGNDIFPNGTTHFIYNEPSIKILCGLASSSNNSIVLLPKEFKPLYLLIDETSGELIELKNINNRSDQNCSIEMKLKCKDLTFFRGKNQMFTGFSSLDLTKIYFRTDLNGFCHFGVNYCSEFTFQTLSDFQITESSQFFTKLFKEYQKVAPLPPSTPSTPSKHSPQFFSSSFFTQKVKVIQTPISEQLIINLMGDEKHYNANDLESGVSSNSIAITHAGGKTFLSELSHYSRTDKIVHLYENDGSIQSKISFSLEKFGNFFKRYILTNLIQLELISLKYDNNLFLSDESSPKIINFSKDAKIFCKFDGHEFQIHPMSLNF